VTVEGCSGLAVLRIQSSSAPGRSYFERITSISFSVYHVEDLLLYSFTRRVSSTPIIACAHAIFSNEEVLRTVDVLVGSTLYAVDDLEPLIQSV
jgi:hypothetical protein